MSPDETSFTVSRARMEVVDGQGESETVRCLRGLGYEHYTVCHKVELSHFVIERRNIIPVSTNHIERVWVELDKTVDHMPLEKTLRSLNLESYRQLRLFGIKESNLVWLLREIA